MLTTTASQGMTNSEPGIGSGVGRPLASGQPELHLETLKASNAPAGARLE